jgi:hypothetical protein
MRWVGLKQIHQPFFSSFNVFSFWLPSPVMEPEGISYEDESSEQVRYASTVSKRFFYFRMNDSDKLKVTHPNNYPVESNTGCVVATLF